MDLKKGGQVGLFNKKSTLTSDYDIVISVVDSLTKGILSIIQKELITEKESELYWAMLTAATSRFLATPEEDQAIQSTIVDLILIYEAKAVKDKDTQSDLKVLKAYENRMNISFFADLYADFPENTQLLGAMSESCV